MTNQKQISMLVTERLGQAIANFDDEGINGAQCDDRVAAVLEAVHMAHSGLITHLEMTRKIETALAGKIERHEDHFPADVANGTSAYADLMQRSISDAARDRALGRISFSSAGAVRRR